MIDLFWFLDYLVYKLDAQQSLNKEKVWYYIITISFIQLYIFKTWGLCISTATQINGTK